MLDVAVGVVVANRPAVRAGVLGDVVVVLAGGVDDAGAEDADALVLTVVVPVRSAEFVHQLAGFPNGGLDAPSGLGRRRARDIGDAPDRLLDPGDVLAEGGLPRTATRLGHGPPVRAEP
jgi:hypothetical protein